MNAKNVFLVAVACFVLGIIVAAGSAYFIIARERSSAANALAEARRIGDDLRTSLDGLTVRLGSIVTDLDGALKEVGRISDVVQRLRARDKIYSEVARRIREIASGLDQGQVDPGIPP